MGIRSKVHGGRNTATQMMFRIQKENRISDLGRNQEKELNEKSIRIYEKCTRIEHVGRIVFLVGPHV